MRRGLAVLVPALLAFGLVVAPVAARSLTPRPEGCTGESGGRERIERLLPLAARVPTFEVDPETTPTPPAVPEGEAADAETVEAITETVLAFVACINAGDLGRMSAFYTDRWLLLSYVVPFSGEPVEEVVAFLAETDPREERDLIWVDDERGVLDDLRPGTRRVADQRHSPAHGRLRRVVRAIPGV